MNPVAPSSAPVVPREAAPAAAATATSTEQPAVAQIADKFTQSAPRSSNSFTLARAMAVPVTVGAGVGVYAGLATGVLAGIAGGVSGFLGGGVIGILAARLVSMAAGKKSDDVFTKLSFPAAIGGALGCGVAGAILGAHSSSPLLAVGLGVVGAVGGALYEVAQLATKG